MTLYLARVFPSSRTWAAAAGSTVPLSEWGAPAVQIHEAESRSTVRTLASAWIADASGERSSASWLAAISVANFQSFSSISLLRRDPLRIRVIFL